MPHCIDWLPKFGRECEVSMPRRCHSGLDPGMTKTSQALKTIIKIKYVLTLGNCRSF
jgi:hypothetical protein